MHPTDLCNAFESAGIEPECKQGIKKKIKKCRSNKRRKTKNWMKPKSGKKIKSCTFRKIFNRVTKRRRRKRRIGSLRAISIQFTNETRRRRRRSQEAVNCSEWRGGRKKRAITVACVIGISALVCIIFSEFYNSSQN